MQTFVFVFLRSPWGQSQIRNFWFSSEQGSIGSQIFNKAFPGAANDSFTGRFLHASFSSLWRWWWLLYPNHSQAKLHHLTENADDIRQLVTTLTSPAVSIVFMIILIRSLWILCHSGRSYISGLIISSLMSFESTRRQWTKAPRHKYRSRWRIPWQRNHWIRPSVPKSSGYYRSVFGRWGIIRFIIFILIVALLLFCKPDACFISIENWTFCHLSPLWFGFPEIV